MDGDGIVEAGGDATGVMVVGIGVAECKGVGVGDGVTSGAGN